MTYAAIIGIIYWIGGAAWTKETEEGQVAQDDRKEQEDRAVQDDRTAWEEQTVQGDRMEQDDRMVQEGRTDRTCQEQEETHRVENVVKRILGEEDSVS